MKSDHRPRISRHGSEWLGDLPGEWEVAPLKRRTNLVVRGRSPEYVENEDGVPIINQACIYWDGLHLGNLKYQDRALLRGTRGMLIKNDLLINSTGTGTLGRAAIFGLDGQYLADSHVTIVRTNKSTVPRFLYYCIQTDIYQGYIYSVLSPGSTNQIELSREGLRNTPFPFPVSLEQKSITSFLDRKTAAIDALIKKIERLIELLQEKRQTLITQAVTKGLDPNVPMKDSGIPWLGEIPRHWEVVRAKVLFRESKERSDTGEEELLTVSHITGVTPRSEKTVYMFEAETLEGYKLCRKGDLAINTMWAWMGALGIVPCDGVVSPSYNVYKPYDQIGVWYYDYLFRTPAFVSEIIRWSKGVWTSRLRLYPNEFFQILLPVPPPDEREQIVSNLRTFLGKDQQLIEKTKLSIDKLQEYRQALISAAVTGMIDVTKEVA